MSQGDVVVYESRGQASVEGARMSDEEVTTNCRWVVVVLLIITAADPGPRGHS